MEYGDGQERVLVRFFVGLFVAGILIGMIAIAALMAAGGGF